MRLRLPDASEADGEPLRVLIVDDEMKDNSLLQQMLRGESYHVLTAAGGAEGLVRLRSEPVDVLLVDLLLPDIDGVGVIRVVRQVWPSIMILAMSGGGVGITQETFLNRARQAGLMGTLTKPFSCEQLIEVADVLSVGTIGGFSFSRPDGQPCGQPSR